jgi:hypothetical protein
VKHGYKQREKETKAQHEKEAKETKRAQDKINKIEE